MSDFPTSSGLPKISTDYITTIKVACSKCKEILPSIEAL